MEEDDNCSICNNFSFFLLLIISGALLTIDGYNLYHIGLTWQHSLEIQPKIFESCIKWQLISRTCFAAFATLAALSSLLLCMFLIAIYEVFKEKILSTYLYYNYLIFGPYMLGFCILGLVYWNNVGYMCSKHDTNILVFNSSNAFYITLCFLTSVLITLGIAIYKTFSLFLDSLLNKPEGFHFIKKLIYWFALRTSNINEIVRNHNNSQNNNNSNNNDINNNHVYNGEYIYAFTI